MLGYWAITTCLLVHVLLLLSGSTAWAFVGPTSTTTTTSTQLEGYKIPTKPRPRVVMDPKTGLYRPEPTTSSSNTSTSEEAPQRGGKITAAWNSLKNTIYGGVDGAKELPSKLKTVGRTNKQKQAIIVDGYKDVQQRVYESDAPGSRLLQEYERRPFLAKESKNEDQSNNSFLSRPIKALKSVVSGSNRSKSTRRQSPAAKALASVSSTLESPKAVVRTNLASSSVVRQSLSDLQSENPVRKLIAKKQLLDLDNTMSPKAMELEVLRYTRARKLKETAYRIGDGLESTVQNLSKVPGQVEDFGKSTANFFQQVVNWITSIPTALQRSADAVAALPSQIQKSVQDTQQSVDQSIEATKKVVKDIQEIPVKTQRTLQETQNKVVAVGNAVDETVVSTKVLLGMEKAIPRPPKSPPPPTRSQVGWKITKAVASGATKAMWWTGKSVAFLTFKGAQAAFTKGQEYLKEQEEGDKKATANQSKPLPPLQKPEDTMTLPPSQTAEASPKQESKSFSKKETVSLERIEDLDRQVSEALSLAEEALRRASDQTTSSKSARSRSSSEE